MTLLSLNRKSELEVRLSLLGSAKDPDRQVGKGQTHSKDQTKLFKLDKLL